jgi:hypothetical protein
MRGDALRVIDSAMCSVKPGCGRALSFYGSSKARICIRIYCDAGEVYCKWGRRTRVSLTHSSQQTGTGNKPVKLSSLSYKLLTTAREVMLILVQRKRHPNRITNLNVVSTFYYSLGPSALTRPICISPCDWYYILRHFLQSGDSGTRESVNMLFSHQSQI